MHQSLRHAEKIRSQPIQFSPSNYLPFDPYQAECESAYSLRLESRFGIHNVGFRPTS